MWNKDYQQYELADFLADEDFKQWAVNKASNPELEQQWQEVQLLYPEKVPMINEALALVKELKALPVFTDNDRQQQLWNQINTVINSQPLFRPVPVKWYYRYAAAVLLCGAATVGVNQYKRQQSFTCQTGFGKDTSFLLPDGSKVMLAANSKVIFRKPQAGMPLRELWVSGEAYFDIKPLAHNSFTVHIDGGVDIRVLGTSFLVKNRNGQTSISLDQGKIQVQIPGAEQHLMQPGETIVANTSTRVITREVTPVAETRQWKEHNIVLQETSVKEIVTLFKNYYNKQLVVSDPAVLERKVDGILPSNNEAEALKALSVILNAEISIQDTTILLKVRN